MAIQNDTDVVTWAKAICDANGAKFIPLSKADMLIVAKWIVGHTAGATDTGTATATATVADTSPEADTDTVADKVENATTSIGGIHPLEEKQDKEVVAIIRNPVETVRDRLVRDGKTTAQQAYDEFNKWKASHQQAAFVMDFSNGVKIPSAAFAWWLGCKASEVFNGD